MSQDFPFPEEKCVEHFCKMLNLRANFLRDQAKLLDSYAEKMLSAADYCEQSQIEDALNGRR
jgi:hypothetical protein